LVGVTTSMRSTRVTPGVEAVKFTLRPQDIDISFWNLPKCSWNCSTLELTKVYVEILPQMLYFWLAVEQGIVSYYYPRRWLAPSWISNNRLSCLDQSKTKVVKILLLRFTAHQGRRKWTVAKIQYMVIAAILEIEKTILILYYLTNLPQIYSYNVTTSI